MRQIGVRRLSFIGIVADLDGRTMFHSLETVLFIEGNILFVLRHPLDAIIEKQHGNGKIWVNL